MRNLIVCAFPSNELTQFGNLITSEPRGSFDVVAVFSPQSSFDSKFFFESCSRIGASNSFFLNIDYLIATDSEQKVFDFLTTLKAYDKIYSHGIQDKNEYQNLIVATTAKAFGGEIWTLADSGKVDRIVESSNLSLSTRIDLLNELYSDSLRNNLISILDISTVTKLQKRQSSSICRYYKGCMNWAINIYDYASPWELKSSKYEMRRYEMEIKALHFVNWHSIVEIGSCEGFFTNLLQREFPQRHIIAIEPDQCFFKTLSAQKIANTKIFNEHIEFVKDIETDIVFTSNVLYYCKEIPKDFFECKAKYYIVCHDEHFHLTYLDKEFEDRCWTCVYEDSIPAVLEEMESFIAIKYGANLKIWKKN